MDWTAGTIRMIALSIALAFATACTTSQGARPDADSAASTLKEMQKVADWQLAHPPKPASVTAPSNVQPPPLGWIWAAFYTGLTSLAERSDDPKYGEAIFAFGERENWGLERRPFHADDYAVGQSWIWAYRRKHDPRMIAALEARFDAIIAAAPTVSLEMGSGPPPDGEHDCHLRWCWSDALFMAPPVWVGLWQATGDPKYLAYADKEYWATTDKLFDPKEVLFYRDSRFLDRRGPHGEKIFWSRGNGWVYAGLARLLELLPPDSPRRARYEDLFRRMSARLITLQKPDGNWPASLLAPAEGTPPETSGTGFFTYGLGYGVKTGLLKEPQYLHAAERGWAALKMAVQPDGKLGWVQSVSDRPDAVSAEDTQPYGVGAFLLAGSVLYDLHAPAAGRH